VLETAQKETPDFSFAAHNLTFSVTADRQQVPARWSSIFPTESVTRPTVFRNRI